MTIATHNGKFHADDVFAVATLLLFLKDKKVEIVRTRDEDKIKVADFVVDVGGAYDPKIGRFDHHQPEGAGKRENGIPYASFGLVWKEFGEKVAGSQFTSRKIDASLVQTIDAIDNGVAPYEELFENQVIYDVGDVMDGFMPSWKEGSKLKIDNAFSVAVKYACEILEREIRRYSDTKEGLDLARGVYQKSVDKRIIVLNAPHPWKEEYVGYPEPLFVVFPMEAGDRWAVKGVPKDVHSFERRLYLPREWWGKRDEELRGVTGVHDALFVHKDGFIGGAVSKEGAIALAKKALEKD